MFVLGEPQYGVLDATQKVAGHELVLRARQIRMEKSGKVTALVALLVDGGPAYSDLVSVDEAEERHSFTLGVYGTQRKLKDGGMSAGRPAKLGDDIIAALDDQKFEHEMMLWSRALWPRFIGASSGAYEHGDIEPSAPHWSVPGLVLQGLTSIWFGEAGANKSTIMRLTAQSLNHGVSNVIPVRDREECIWVNAEEDPSEHTRQLGNVNAALGLARDSRLFTIHARGMGIEDLAQRLERAVRETDAQHIFVDSLSRLSRGMNLNENATANLLMDSLAGLGPSVNWIGHTGQDNAWRLAGSKHFANAARLMVRVQSRIDMGGISPELTRGLRTQVTKGNGLGAVVPMHWTLEYHRDFGLLRAEKADYERWPVLHCSALVGETKKSECRRKTWDGVQPSGAVLCPRHRGEDQEE